MTADLSSRVVKRSLSIQGHRTSISLEEDFWLALKSIAECRGTSLAGLVAEIDQARSRVNLSSALRVFVLRDFQTQRVSTDSGIAITPPVLRET